MWHLSIIWDKKASFKRVVNFRKLAWKTKGAI